MKCQELLGKIKLPLATIFLLNIVGIAIDFFTKGTTPVIAIASILEIAVIAIAGFEVGKKAKNYLEPGKAGAIIAGISAAVFTIPLALLPGLQTLQLQKFNPLFVIISLAVSIIINMLLGFAIGIAGGWIAQRKQKMVKK